MPLDAICLSAVAEELKAAVLGGKIDKIYQPVRDEIVMAVRGSRENVKLLLSASPNHPRVQLTRITRENPDTPPMFCMLLRKHLTGARILDISDASMTVEMTGQTREMDGFIRHMEPLGILEMARTGITALARGDCTILEDD